MKQSEKDQLYQQMTMVLAEVHRLLKIYEELKVHAIEEIKFNDQAESVNIPKENKIFAKEIENQKYLSDRKISRSGYDFQTLALTIASILKESGRPLASKEIHEALTKKGYVLTRLNLTNNILRKINLDKGINVERAYRGYWQYRLT
ncbi:hypothetical protein [Enterococcus avium]|uniref:hypothetical protein n=1 Tax=Enterococcus avium TaxID=33945 RepID=UPI00270F4416|nr:hypothetical protein [Enterococcus avium]MDO7798979.1 hypothetical protein [Enterococcus avium]